MKRLSPKIRLEFLDCQDQQRRSSSQSEALVARITLNKPKALNALDLEMVESMLDVLGHIRQDDSIVALVLDSEGDKAFCAGGDIVSMYQAMSEQTDAGQTPEFLQSFFTQEYRLDYCLHTFPKPVIVWGNGIIMGGGLGVFMGSEIRLVTETARIAMPEITIGLFPDVGGSYFLNRLPPGVGLFLGLSAASINAQDTLDTGIADAFVWHDDKVIFMQELLALPKISKETVVALANKLTAGTQLSKEGNLTAEVAQLHSAENLKHAHEMLSQLATSEDDKRYFQKALAAFEGGSPITAHLVFEQLKRAQNLSLAECFRMELSMAFTCGALGEFKEGVRALLIDKDNTPKWRYSSYEEVPSELIDQHFSRFKRTGFAAHPLAHLEDDFGVKLARSES